MSFTCLPPEWRTSFLIDLQLIPVRVFAYLQTHSHTHLQSAYKDSKERWKGERFLLSGWWDEFIDEEEVGDSDALCLLIRGQGTEVSK